VRRGRSWARSRAARTTRGSRRVSSIRGRTATPSTCIQAQQAAQNTAAQTDLQRKTFESANRSASAKQALIGALLGGGITPTKIGPGGASGGILRSLNANPEALAAMKMLGSQGSAAQAMPLEFAGGQQMVAPTLSAAQKIDTGGGTMGTLQKIAQLFGAVSPYMHGSGDDGGNGASKPTVQTAVDVMGGIPGGAIVPRTVDPRLQSRPIDLYGRGNY
jgi:hypothetical protein